MQAAIEASALSYLPHELEILKILQGMFHSEFRKEKIGNRYFDFANDRMLIEHTTDYGKGIQSVIQRFTEVVSDPRTKIAFLNHKYLGIARRRKLESVGVQIRNIEELQNDRA
jgi:hypothetical protein